MKTSLILTFLQLLAIPFITAVALNCSRGSVPINSRCRDCRPGTYHSQLKNACLPCPPGTYSTVSGAQAVDICQPCPKLTFNDKTGASSRSACKPCRGSVYAGSSSCLLCPKDFRPDTFGSRCTRCPPLAFTTMKGANKCLACSDDRFINSRKVGPLGKGRCEKCPAGTGANDFTCRKCDGMRGEFNDGTFTGCRGCPPGFMGSKAAGATACKPCPRGTARDTSGAGAPCYKCPQKHNTNVTGGISCVPDDTPCPANFFRNLRGACDRCSKSERYNPRKRRCEPCPKNYASNGGLSKRCSPCGPSAVGGENGCVCPPGTSRRIDGKKGCQKCPPGTFNLFFEGTCHQCLPGTFSRTAGMKECLDCPSNSAQPEYGQNMCIRCAKGLVGKTLENYGIRPSNGGLKDLIESRCVSPKSDCPPGQRRIETRSGRLAGCKAPSCPKGTFAITVKGGNCPFCLAEDATYCIKCSTSERYNPSTNSCVQCKDNEVSNGGTSTVCRKCPGAEVRFNGKCACVSDSTSYPMIARGVSKKRCRICPAGTFGLPGGSICAKCSPGTFQNKPGQTQCIACPENTFSKKAGAMKCTRCEKGFTSIVRFSEASSTEEYYTRVQSVGSSNCVRIGSLKD